MKYNEKDVEEYLNRDDINLQIETSSQISTIIGILIENNIVTREKFDETQKELKEEIKKITKEKIKQQLEKMNEEKIC